MPRSMRGKWQLYFFLQIRSGFHFQLKLLCPVLEGFFHFLLLSKLGETCTRVSVKGSSGTNMFSRLCCQWHC